AWPVKSYHELRYEHVRGQNTSTSCGPASLATLFSEFYGEDITEQNIVELMKPYLEEEIEKLKEGKLPEGGVSMLDLKKVSEELGFPAKGYEVPKENLPSIMRKLRVPLLIHLEKPDEHFSLAVTEFNGQFFLADPTWGVRAIGKGELFDRWDGLILAFSPRNDRKRLAQEVIERIKKKVEDKHQTQRISREFLWDLPG
ncbi:MAG: C39 family peptidase, partial [Candidatus Bipolaricaulota bacterium]